jgi:NAD(P)-dependent dehydrogenase (short-subunit alcohol dehydrogenase family)
MVGALFDLGGKVAVITGGSRGIGAGIAHAYAKVGARVVIAGRKAGPLQEAVENLRAGGADALGVPTHCGRPEEVEHLMTKAVEAYGSIDILVNNAATSPHFGPVLEATDELWRKTLEINVLGYFHAARCAVALMDEARGGKVINVSSVAATEPMPGLGVYGISKAAVSAMTRELALEVAGQNIQVNALAPGLIRTSFSRALWEDEKNARYAMAKIPAGRFGEVEDLIGAALFLASSASDYTTGIVLTVDGGYSVA